MDFTTNSMCPAFLVTKFQLITAIHINAARTMIGGIKVFPPDHNDDSDAFMTEGFTGRYRIEGDPE